MGLNLRRVWTALTLILGAELRVDVHAFTSREGGHRTAPSRRAIHIFTFSPTNSCQSHSERESASLSPAAAGARMLHASSAKSPIQVPTNPSEWTRRSDAPKSSGAHEPWTDWSPKCPSLPFRVRFVEGPPLYRRSHRVCGRARLVFTWGPTFSPTERPLERSIGETST
jgi:hypothetical protein